MKKVLVFMANGFEEIEEITVVDILRRAGAEVDMCSIHDTLMVEGAHGVRLEANLLLKDIADANVYDAVFAPGGMPGATNLRDDTRVIDIIRAFYDKAGKYIVSICAAPILLGKAGIAHELAGTCYPGFEGQVGYKEYHREAVVESKNVITSMGPGTAFRLALKVVEVLCGEDAASRLYDETQLKYSCE